MARKERIGLEREKKDTISGRAGQYECHAIWKNKVTKGFNFGFLNYSAPFKQWLLFEEVMVNNK